MNIKILLAFVVLFFSFQAIQAQDIVQPVKKHSHKTPVSDSTKTKVSHSSHASQLKDTNKTHKQHSVFVPKYPRTGYVSITGGLGMPIAGFAANEGAGAGSNISINAAFPGIISHGGIAFKLDYGTNGFDNTRFLNILNNNGGLTNINTSYASTVTGCSHTSFLTGLYLTYPAQRLTIDVRMLVGVMIATIPTITVNYYDQTNNTNGTSVQAQTSASAFAINLGIEARYAINFRYCAIFSIDYVHAVPTFPMVITGAELTSTGNIMQGNQQQLTTNQAFSLCNFAVGVGYTISAKK